MERHNFMAMFVITAFFLCNSNCYAESQEIIGVYQKNLTEYSDDGRRVGEVKVEDLDMHMEVLATNPKKLVKVKFNGEEHWFRASQLKFKVPELAKCPKRPPGSAPDLEKPAASGAGPECKP